MKQYRVNSYIGFSGFRHIVQKRKWLIFWVKDKEFPNPDEAKYYCFQMNMNEKI